MDSKYQVIQKSDNMTYFKYNMNHSDEHYFQSFQAQIDKLENPNDKDSIKQLLFDKLQFAIEYYVVYLVQDYESIDQSLLLGNKMTVPLIKKINKHFEILNSIELNNFIFNSIEERLNKYIPIEQQNSIVYRTYLKGILKLDFIMNEQWYDSFDGIYNYNLLKYLIIKSRYILADNIHSSYLKDARSPLKLILDQNNTEFLKYL